MPSTTRTGLAVLIALVALVVPVAQAGAAPVYPPGFQEQVVAGGFSKPNDFAFAPDGRIFVAEDVGRVKVVKTDGTVSTLLDISSHVNSYSDRGLLGIEVDANFATNHFVYLLYVYEDNPMNASGEKVSRLTRITVNDDNTLVNPLSPETIILGTHSTAPCPAPDNGVDCIPAERDSHAIGTIRSAPDGTLWLGSGDAAPHFTVRSDISFRPYDERSFAGKIIHIDRNGNGLPGHPFCPANANLSDVCTKLWAKGFRNPFRFHLRSGGKHPIIGDVGQAAREEMDVARPGKDYGWPCYEGNTRTPGYNNFAECKAEYAKEGTADAAVGPTYTYLPTDAGSCIILGPVYTGNAYPSAWKGDIFVGDYVQGWLRRLTLDANDNVVAVNDFGSGWQGVEILNGPDGNLYYADLGFFQPGKGTIKKIVYQPGNGSPTARAAASPDAGPLPLEVQFTGSGSSDPDGDPLTYDWDFGDGSPHSTAANPTHTYTTKGTFTATLTVDDGSGRTSTSQVVISPGSTRPQMTIDSPADESTYRAGVPVDLSGSGEDPEDGPLPDSALSWQVVLVHNTHKHEIGSFTGGDVSFTPTTDHGADSYYEIAFRGTDSDGLVGTRTLTLRPETVDFTLDSNVPGAPLSYASEKVAAPYTTQELIGFENTVAADEHFDKQGISYGFQSWSDGGARGHAIAIPAEGLTLTATYAPVSLVSVEGSTLRVNAKPGVANRIALTQGSGTATVHDDGGPLDVGPGCTASDAATVTCSLTGVTKADVDADDGADQVTVAGTLPATIRGGTGDDAITGGSGDDTLDPGVGRDDVRGGAGKDRVTYADRTDQVRVSLDDYGNDGAPGEADNVRNDVETLEGGSGDDVLVGNSAGNRLEGGPGHDYLEPGTGKDVVVGGTGADGVSYYTRAAALSITLDGIANDGASGEGDDVQSDVENLTGGEGADTLVGNGQDNRLNGRGGNDVLEPRGGTDFAGGGAGTDRVTYQGVSAAVRITPNGLADDGPAGENDNVWTDVEDLHGGEGGDTIIGNGADNQISGRGGDDYLEPLAGKDRVSGGAGSDRASYHTYTQPVKLSLDDFGNDGVAGEGDNLLTDIENVNGGSGDDTIVGSNAGNSLYGGPGNDFLQPGTGKDDLWGGSGTDRASYFLRTQPVRLSLDDFGNDGVAGEGDNIRPDVEGLHGGEGDDVLVGNNAGNTLSGRGGADFLQPGTGKDDLSGGAGEDRVSYFTRSAPLTLSIDGQANDGAAGENDQIFGDVENLSGGDGADVITGNAQANNLAGRGGDDVIDGGTGGDTLSGGEGTDTVTYQSRTQAVSVRFDSVANDGQSGENDQLFGDLENVTGGSGNDTLFGTSAANRILGNGGNDSIDPGRGADEVLAGAGADDVLIRDGEADTASCGDGADTITADAVDTFGVDCETPAL